MGEYLENEGNPDDVVDVDDVDEERNSLPRNSDGDGDVCERERDLIMRMVIET